MGSSVGPGQAGVFGPLSKVPGRVFASGRGFFQTAKRNVRMFVQMDTPHAHVRN